MKFLIAVILISLSTTSFASSQCFKRTPHVAADSSGLPHVVCVKELQLDLNPFEQNSMHFIGTIDGKITDKTYVLKMVEKVGNDYRVSAKIHNDGTTNFGCSALKIAKTNLSFVVDKNGNILTPLKVVGTLEIYEYDSCHDSPDFYKIEFK